MQGGPLATGLRIRVNTDPDSTFDKKRIWIWFLIKFGSGPVRKKTVSGSNRTKKPYPDQTIQKNRVRSETNRIQIRH